MKKILFTMFLFINTLSSQGVLPDVYLKTLTGKSVNTKTTYNNNGLTIYSFWATWCVPCINELDDINSEIEKWNKANVKIVAISTDDSRTKRRIRPLINGKKWGFFNILLDENHDLKKIGRASCRERV